MRQIEIKKDHKCPEDQLKIFPTEGLWGGNLLRWSIGQKEDLPIVSTDIKK